METKNEKFGMFWRKQKEIIDRLPLKYTITDRKCGNKKAKYHHIMFQSMDGSRIHAKYIRPAHGKNVPIVFDFHDYKEGSQSWLHLTRYIALDYAVIAMDARGQGGKSEDRSIGTPSYGSLMKGIEEGVDHLYFCKVYLDAYLLSKIIMSLDGLNENKMIAFGRGQGGAIAMALSVLNSNIKKCSMLYPLFCDIKSNQHNGIYEEIRYFFRKYDPTHQQANKLFHLLSYIDLLNFAPKLNCSVLMGTALLDTISDPTLQKKVFQEIKSQKKQIVFPAFEHERINHFEDENRMFMKFDEV